MVACCGCIFIEPEVTKTATIDLLLLLLLIAAAVLDVTPW
jgi:hypothetical protein